MNSQRNAARFVLFMMNSVSQTNSLASCQISTQRHFSRTNRNDNKRDLYSVLGLPPKARAADIKNSYYKLSMVYHPDKNKSAEAAKKFREITEAYEVLGNYRLKRLYDKGDARIFRLETLI